MPHGRYVAFVPGTERLHKHSDLNPDQRELFIGERVPYAVSDPGNGRKHNPTAGNPKQGELFDDRSEDHRPRKWIPYKTVFLLAVLGLLLAVIVGIWLKSGVTK